MAAILSGPRCVKVQSDIYYVKSTHTDRCGYENTIILIQENAFENGGDKSGGLIEIVDICLYFC